MEPDRGLSGGGAQQARPKHPDPQTPDYLHERCSRWPTAGCGPCERTRGAPLPAPLPSTRRAASPQPQHPYTTRNNMRGRQQWSRWNATEAPPPAPPPPPRQSPQTLPMVYNAGGAPAPQSALHTPGACEARVSRRAHCACGSRVALWLQPLPPLSHSPPPLSTSLRRSLSLTCGWEHACTHAQLRSLLPPPQRRARSECTGRGVAVVRSGTCPPPTLIMHWWLPGLPACAAGWTAAAAAASPGACWH